MSTEYRKVFETGGPNVFKKMKGHSYIELWQRGRNGRFKVIYGLQTHSKLNYSEACCELGQCILHHLACNGDIGNEGP